MPVNKSLAEAGIFCKARAMGNTPFVRRFATPMCAVALLCSVQGSFAQSPPESPSLIGKWRLPPSLFWSSRVANASLTSVIPAKAGIHGGYRKG
jgi:hypothetical protein